MASQAAVRYALRPTLSWAQDGRGWQVRDPELQRVVRLGDMDALVARGLRTPRTFAELVQRTGLPVDEVAARLTGLARL